MTEQALQHDIAALIQNLGGLGVYLAMLLESSIVPIPSEVVVVGAGAIGIPLLSIVVFGSLGSTCGAAVGYCLGRYGAMPVILRYGRYVLIRPEHVHKAEAFARQYGAASVLIGRLVPVVPFKVFSIAAGITRLSFAAFMVCTFIGVVPRMLILALCGNAIMRYKAPALVALCVVALAYIAFRMYRGRRARSGSIGQGSP